jgi:hypothetical protein
MVLFVTTLNGLTHTIKSLFSGPRKFAVRFWYSSIALITQSLVLLYRWKVNGSMCLPGLVCLTKSTMYTVILSSSTSILSCLIKCTV